MGRKKKKVDAPKVDENLENVSIEVSPAEVACDKDKNQDLANQPIRYAKFGG